MTTKTLIKTTKKFLEALESLNEVPKAKRSTKRAVAHKVARKAKAKAEPVFAKGQYVNVAIIHGGRLHESVGTVTKLPPVNPGRGENRLGVRLIDGSTIRPYVSQCSLRKGRRPAAAAA